jgi:hypothetical protein
VAGIFPGGDGLRNRALPSRFFSGELVDRARLLEDVLLLDALGHDADAQRLGDALEPSVLAAAKRTTG